MRNASFYAVIVPYGTAQAFATGVTTLLAFTDYGSDYEDLCVVLENDDASLSVDLVVDVSHAGTYKNAELTQTHTVGPVNEGRVALPSPNPDRYLRVQVNNGGASVLGKWALLGHRR